MKKDASDHVIRAAFWGAVLGGAVGFALGVLLAPEEGRQLQRRLRYRLENLGKQAGNLADRVLNPEAESEARRTGDALIADARVEAQRIRNDIDALLGEVKKPGSPRPSSPSVQ